MLQLLNSDKEILTSFKDYKNLSIESVLSTGDSTLSFLYSVSGIWNDQLIEEGYIRNKTNEYVIKSRRVVDDEIEITCVLNLEDLEGNPFDRYTCETETITNALNLALVGSGWTTEPSTLTKKRTVRKTCCSTYDIIQEIKKIYRVDLRFDTLKKRIYVYEKLGDDKGAYAIESLNLTSLSVESDSYEYFTRIIPVGKEDLTIESINDGKNYVENYQYTNKVKSFYWKDERYTVAESLKEDAIAKLEEISKPYRSYSGEIKNLAKISKKYTILEFGLGDTITLISKNKKIKDKQRIVKITEYPQDPTKDTFEIANLNIRFEDQQDRFEEAADIIDNITTDDGTVSGDAIDEITTDKIKNFTAEIGKVVNLEAINAKFDKLEVNKADITDLNVVTAKVGTLEVTKANITELNATNATIEILKANKADITELNAVTAKIGVLEVETAKIGVLEGNVANIQDIIGGNISSDNIQTGGITGDRLNMSTIFVTDANIVNINASKINSGEIDTSKIRIKSEDGAIEIAGATQQFRDKNKNIRIQMGQDLNGDFNFILKGEDGATTLIDSSGVKENAIADDLIKENMLSEDAVGEKQINYNSFATGFNKETNTTFITGSKVILDNKNQTLDIAFNTVEHSIEEVSKNVNYDVEIISTNGIVFKNGIVETQLIAIVRKGKEDVTEKIDESRFIWTRISDDAVGDEIWNQQYVGGRKKVAVTKSDIQNRATFNCEILE